MGSNPIHADVFNTCPKMLRSLRQRFHHQIPSIARGRLCHAMRRQIPEKLGATRTAFPRTECGNDAVRRSTWKMNEAGRYHRWKRGGVYDKKDTSTLHNGCLPASIIKAISLNCSTGFSRHFVYQELELCTKTKKNIALRNLAPNPALAPEGRALFSSGGINTGGIHLPNPEQLHSYLQPSVSWTFHYCWWRRAKDDFASPRIRQFFGDKTFAR